MEEVAKMSRVNQLNLAAQLCNWAQRFYDDDHTGVLCGADMQALEDIINAAGPNLSEDLRNIAAWMERDKTDRKTPCTIHSDPRNAIVTGEAVLVIGPGRVSFHGQAEDLDPQAIADAWALAGALRDDDEPAAPDVPAAVETLREERDELREIVERQTALISKLQQQRRDMRAALRMTLGLLEKYVPDAEWQLSDHAGQIYVACQDDEGDG